jgi:hypothetical protein
MVGAGHTHADATQLAVGGQTVLHEPQCEVLSVRSKHDEPHEVCPDGHPHSPAEHTCPEGHAIPQKPQFIGSFCRSTHCVPHVLKPPAHPQLPLVHVRPVPHDVPSGAVMPVSVHTGEPVAHEIEPT